MRKHVFVNNLWFTYKNKNDVLKDISMQINENEMHLIIGKNGAGKSSFIKVLAGLYIKKKGKVENTFHKMAYVPDKSKFPPHIEVKDYLASLLMVSENINIKEAYIIIEKYKERMNISDLLTLNPNSISAGQIKKILISLSLMRNCDLVIMDEPFANLDANAIKELMNYIKKHQNKITFVICSHVLKDFDNMAQNISVFNKGKIVYSGSIKKAKTLHKKKTIDRLYNYYLNQDVN